ncbi:hypothetical protein EDD85DRAFT_869657 [Armillaria nabsnona]|nr:hypothetical protein EDD85DRAFT_869657 [Armillaria nabsnona]
MAPVTLLSIVGSLSSVLGWTLGAIYVGVTIAAVFYGITILQTVVYYKEYPDDSWLFRYGVALLWILDTFHVAISTHALYFYLVESFGNYIQVLKIIWSFQLQLVVNMLIVVGVQGLYAVRIWKFGRNYHKVLPWLIFLAVAACLGAGMYGAYEMYTLSSYLEISRISTAIYVVFSTAVAADFCIAATMCYYLHRGRSMARSSTTSTTKIIVGLMRFAVMSGLTTSACSLFTLVAYIAWPNSLVFLAADFILPKLYINSLLAMLNARSAQRRAETKEYSTDNSTLRFSPPTVSSGTTDVAEMSVNAALSVMERSHSNDGTDTTCTREKLLDDVVTPN